MPCNHWNILVLSMLPVHLLCLPPQLICSQPSSSLNDKAYWVPGYLSLYSYLALIWSCLLLQICFLYSRYTVCPSLPPELRFLHQKPPSTGRTQLLSSGRNKSLLLLSAFISAFTCHGTASVSLDPSSNQLSEALNWAIFYFLLWRQRLNQLNMIPVICF